MINWQHFWQQRGIGNFALLPASALFYGLTALRRKLFDCGFLKSQKATMPVVVVGNINVGGAGKTPLVIALAKLLHDNGIRCAVISKGYGGSYDKPTIVEKTDLASVVGDEPLLIKVSCDCPVVVAQSRFEAAHIVAENFPETHIILTDDGLQHYQLSRDVEVCVINHSIGLGNSWVLPAGGLREPPSRLNSVDFVVSNGGVGHKYHYVLADRGWYHINSGERRYHDDFVSNKDQNMALSGIAHPDLFFKRLKDLGMQCDEYPLPDHHAITESDLPAGKTLLMTEKDWVKAKSYPHVDAWYLAVEAVLSEPLKKDFLQHIQRLIARYE
ncbi:MAG: tetraacyldisaccharide 4'-kinase [Gammaproteobacteria bacterium]|nr:tetraacyldisaccharide 4'-kinase [Gammaproteobacteria bacterium]